MSLKLNCAVFQNRPVLYAKFNADHPYVEAHYSFQLFAVQGRETFFSILREKQKKKKQRGAENSTTWISVFRIIRSTII
jgi:hypothetical protein